MEALRQSGGGSAETFGNGGHTSPLAELLAKRGRVLRRRGFTPNRLPEAPVDPSEDHLPKPSPFKPFLTLLKFDPSEPRDETGEWTAGSARAKSPKKPKAPVRAPTQKYHGHLCHWGHKEAKDDTPEGGSDEGKWRGFVPGWGRAIACTRHKRDLKAKALPESIQRLPKDELAYHGTMEGYDRANHTVWEDGQWKVIRRSVSVGGNDITAVNYKPQPNPLDKYKDLLKSFDPNEPRDDSGEWTEGGGSGKKPAAVKWFESNGVRAGAKIRLRGLGECTVEGDPYRAQGTGHAYVVRVHDRDHNLHLFNRKRLEPELILPGHPLMHAHLRQSTPGKYAIVSTWDKDRKVTGHDVRRPWLAQREVRLDRDQRREFIRALATSFGVKMPRVIEKRFTGSHEYDDGYTDPVGIRLNENPHATFGSYDDARLLAHEFSHWLVRRRSDKLEEDAQDDLGYASHHHTKEWAAVYREVIERMVKLAHPDIAGPIDVEVPDDHPNMGLSIAEHRAKERDVHDDA